MKSVICAGTIVLLVKLVVFVWAIEEESGEEEYYQNPIIPKFDNPDPGGIYVGGVYYVATTSGDAPSAFPIHGSSDLVNWTTRAYVFPKWPAWIKQDLWAPEIHLVNGMFIVYYAARNRDGVLCVGAAAGKNVLGPYIDRGSPLIHQASMGNIDPTFFHDQATGKQYLIWKEDGNGHNPPVPTNIWAQELTKDGLDVVGEKTSIFVNNASSWEGPLVEGPWVINYESAFYLFYSGNAYNTPRYAIGVAQSTHILGPYIRNPLNPIIHSNSHWSGPGHCSVLRVANVGQHFFIYHSWVVNQVGPPYNRLLMLDTLRWERRDGRLWPYITDSSPSFDREPVP